MSNLKIKAVLILVAVIIAGGFVWQFKKTEQARTNINAKTGEGKTPLEIAKSNNNADITALLEGK